MPVADKFMSDGVGNGFPFCLTKDDVSGFDHWTTLSGVNKGNVGGFTDEELDEKIQESLVLAMAFYWNGFSVDAYAEAILNSSTSIADGADVTGSAYELPRDRVCGTASGQSGEQVGSSFADMALFFPKPFIVMNDGVFVGYGVDGIPVSMRASALGPFTEILLIGALEIEETSSANNVFDYAYVDTNGGSFVCIAHARRGLASSTLIADAANMDAEVVRPDLSRSAKCSISTIDTFDFYTYPT